METSAERQVVLDCMDMVSRRRPVREGREGRIHEILTTSKKNAAAIC
jgi:hypothetical protein